MEMTDIHAHILPGIDDGPETMEETRRMLRKAFEQGIRSIIATPHYFRRHYEPEVRQIYELVSAVQAEADTLTPGLRIYPGQEIMHFYEIEEFLLEKKVIPLAGTRYVLIFAVRCLQQIGISDAENDICRLHSCACPCGALFLSEKEWEAGGTGGGRGPYADELSEPGNGKELFRQAMVP